MFIFHKYRSRFARAIFMDKYTRLLLHEQGRSQGALGLQPPRQPSEKYIKFCKN